MKRIVLIWLSWFLWFSIMSLQAQTQYPLDTIDGVEYYRYTVEKSIGLYRISHNFGVSQEQILEANPELMQRGIRYGEVILIPTLRTVAVPVDTPLPVAVAVPVDTPLPVAIPVASPTVKEGVSIPEVTVLSAPQDTTDSIAPTLNDSTPVLRIALLLPLQAEVQKRQKNIDRFYDFYAGILLAANELQRSGSRFEIYVYDTGKTVSELTTLMAEEGLRNVDAVIGPAFAQQVEEVAGWMKEFKKPFVVPFTNAPNAIHDNPYLFQFNPSEQLEADTLATYLSERADSVNCILIETEEEKIPESILILRQALATHHVPTTTTTIHAILVDSLDLVLQRDKENIFLFNTERYANIRALMPHLTLASTTASVTLLSRYSWQKEHISLPQLYTSVFHVAVTPSNSYQQMYDHYFAHTLSSSTPRYDLLGYDILHQLVSELLSAKQSTETDPSEPLLYRGVQSDISYRQTHPNGGYENAMIHIVHQ